MSPSAKRACKEFLEEGIIWITCLAVTWLVGLALELFPPPEAYVETVERLHFAAVYFCLLTMSTQFVMKLFLRATAKPAGDEDAQRS